MDPDTLYNQDKLSHEELIRYSRHIIMPEFCGQQGQLALKKTKIIVIGAGGLGNITCKYLAALGFGNITIVDDDQIELNNLNRQISYTLEDISKNKAEILKSNLLRFNSAISVEALVIRITYQNSATILQGYDVVADCTDNPQSRYCINDTCAHLKIPLVFGSALRWEGQLSVFGYSGGPCLRCIFPTPPHPDLIGSCDNDGIVGPIVGIIGSMQALETVKIVLRQEGVLSRKLFLFNGLTFKTNLVTLREKNPNCLACSKDALRLGDLEFSASHCCKQYAAIDPKLQISVEDYMKMIKDSVPHVLVDVRTVSQYNCFRLDNSINIPLEKLLKMNCEKFISYLSHYDKMQLGTVCVICRRGMYSRDAVAYLTGLLSEYECPIKKVYDINGGFLSWSKLDTNFPFF